MVRWEDGTMRAPMKAMAAGFIGGGKLLGRVGIGGWWGGNGRMDMDRPSLMI